MSAVWKNHDGWRPAPFSHTVFEHSNCIHAREFAASVAVKVVNDGELLVGDSVVFFRQIDAVADVLVSKFAVKRQVLNSIGQW